RSNQLSYRPNSWAVQRSTPPRSLPQSMGCVQPTALQTQSSFQCIKQFVWALMATVMSSIKEVIQPQVPLRLPCYDFTPVMNHSVVTVLPRVRLATSGATHSHGVTGGVYKARERIHRDILIHDY